MVFPRSRISVRLARRLARLVGSRCSGLSSKFRDLKRRVWSMTGVGASEIRWGVEGSGLAGRHYDRNAHVSPRIKTLSILLRTWMVWVRWAWAVDVFTQINTSVEVALVAWMGPGSSELERMVGGGFCLVPASESTVRLRILAGKCVSARPPVLPSGRQSRWTFSRASLSCSGRR